MTTDKHVDPAAAVPVGDGEEDSNLQDVPEGAVRFELDRAEIEEALAAPSMQVASLFTYTDDSVGRSRPNGTLKPGVLTRIWRKSRISPHPCMSRSL